MYVQDIIFSLKQIGKLKRSELFIVTKLPLQGMMPDRVEKYMDLSLKNLGLDFVDLYLIQCPLGCKEFEDSESSREEQVNYHSLHIM